jgi:TonB family protein
MSDQNDNSSLPLLMGITAAIVLCIGGGWFLLERNDSAHLDRSETIAPPPIPASLEVATEAAATATDINMDLRKARLAAQSDLLAYPGGQSALHFYGRVLAAQPDHATARAEFDEVLEQISQQVSRQLDARDFDDAYGLASRVAEQEPGHALVSEARKTLDAYAAELADQALQHARDGNDDDAETLLASAAALPGRDARYLSTLRASIADIQQARRDAAQEKRQRATQAAADARNAWQEKFRGAIAAGRLISPAGDCARDYLAAKDMPQNERGQLTGELVAALLGSSQYNIESNQLQIAESMLDAADELGGAEASLAELRATLDDAYVRAEEARVRTTQEMVRLQNAPARYPGRAEERGISGWVEVIFTVNTAGETADIEVVEAEPESIFDDSAVTAVSRWTFQPLEFRGRIINQRAVARLVYRLE